MKINYVTTNAYKFQNAQRFFSELKDKDVELIQYDLETPEVQEESVEVVAKSSAQWVTRQIGQAAVSMDVGFCIETLKGFPGPFLKFINNWLQPNDMLNLMKGKENRKAYFIDALAYATPGGETKVFVVKTAGVIIDADTLPDTDWTIDAVFIPEGHTKTLAEMDDEEKNSVWSGGLWSQLVDYLRSE